MFFILESSAITINSIILIRSLANNKRFVRILLFVFLVINFGIFTQISANTAFSPSSSSDQNIFTKVSVQENEQSGFCGVEEIKGIGPGIFYAISSVFTGDGKGYTHFVSAFKDKPCITTTDSTQTNPENGVIKVQTLTLPELENYADSLSQNGLLAMADRLNGTILDQRPVSAVDFVQNKVYALSHPGAVYAAQFSYYSPGGTGYDLLRPIQGFWSWSVRVVYGVLILIVIVLALAIMFRQKLSSNVEITIQNAIPSIALAMILVPLSYAISGVFIDAIALGTNVAQQFLIGQPSSPGYALYLNRSKLTTNIVGKGGDQSKIPDNSDGKTNPDGSTTPGDRYLMADDPRIDWIRVRNNFDISSQFTKVAQPVADATGISGFPLFRIVWGFMNNIIGNKQNDGSVAWLGDVITFFISLVSIWVAIQIFIKLFKKYLTLIMYPIISPFIFATVAIPGNGSKTIMQYLKTLGSASLFFIVTYVMFLLSLIFISPDFQQTVPNLASGSFSPPLLGLSNIGFSGPNLTVLLLTLIGLGIYFSIPKTLDDIDKALGTTATLPEFVKTPIDSFKESYNKVFKQAPAIGARAAKTGLAVGRNTLYAPTRGLTAAADLRDRLRGKTPGDVGTYRYNQRQRLANEYDKNKQLYEDAKNPVAKAYYRSKMVAANVAGQAAGTGLGTPEELKATAPALEAKLVPKSGYSTGKDNELAFTKADMDTLTAGGPVNIEMQLVLELKNSNLPTRGSVEVGDAAFSAARRGLAEFKSFATPQYITDGIPILGTAEKGRPAVAVPGIHATTIITGSDSLVAGAPPNLVVYGGVNNKYTVRIVLTITPGVFFGAFDPVKGAYVGGSLTSGVGKVTFKDRMFKVKELGIETTVPLNLTIYAGK